MNQISHDLQRETLIREMRALYVSYVGNIGKEIFNKHFNATMTQVPLHDSTGFNNLLLKLENAALLLCGKAAVSKMKTALEIFHKEIVSSNKQIQPEELCK